MSAGLGWVLVDRDSRIDEAVAITGAERASPAARFDSMRLRPQVDRIWRRKILKTLDSGTELAAGAAQRLAPCEPGCPPALT
jgi:hypothetical protein